MTRPNDLAARAAKVAVRPARKPATSTEDPAPTAKKIAAPRVKPVRLSLDLAPQSYRSLKGVCDELAVELGRARVTQSEVLRVLVTLLDEDPTLRQTLTETLREEQPRG